MSREKLSWELEESGDGDLVYSLKRLNSIML